MNPKTFLLIILAAMQSYGVLAQSYILRGNPTPPSGTVNTNIYQDANFIGLNTATPVANLEIRSACAVGNEGTLLLTRSWQACPFAWPPTPSQVYGDYFVIKQENVMGDPTYPFVVKSGGSVGVGTNNPDARLDLRGGSGYALISGKDQNNNVRFVAHGNGSVAINTSTTTNALLEMKNNSGSLPIILARDNSNNVKLSLTNDGRMGINQQSPSTTLEVRSSNSNHYPLKVLSNTGQTKLLVRNDDWNVIVGGENAWNNAALTINETNFYGGLELLSTYNNSTVFNRIFFSKAGVGTRHFVGDDNNNGRLIIDPGVGAGAADILQVKGRLLVSPNNDNDQPDGAFANYRMAVNGNLIATRVVVQTGSWSDHVFADDYKLATLNEVAAFIKQHRHLPEIPSEKEVLENGIDTGEMSRLLLQKVEELTLYILQQQEQINLLNAKLK